MRAFAGSRSASHESPTGSASTSFDNMRFRYDAASGPRTATYDLGRGAVCNVVTAIETRVPSVFRSRAERKVAEAGYDPARLPPGQYLTEKWPVLHAGDVPSYPPALEGWDFRVDGEVDTPITLTWDELNDLPKVSVTADIHCVARGSRFDAEFTGVPWAAIRGLIGQSPSAHYAIAHAEAGYTANVPASSLDAEGAVLATHADG